MEAKGEKDPPVCLYSGPYLFPKGDAFLSSNQNSADHARPVPSQHDLSVPNAAFTRVGLLLEGRLVHEAAELFPLPLSSGPHL